MMWLICKPDDVEAGKFYWIKFPDYSEWLVAEAFAPSRGLVLSWTDGGDVDHPFEGCEIRGPIPSPSDEP